MRPEDIRKLLGGYATGTLTPEERQALFEAALDDQELFDALAQEQPLRDLLDDPASRAHLLAALDDNPLPWFRRFEHWLWGHAVGLAAVACFLTVGGYVVWQAREWRKPALIAEMERQSIEVREPALPDLPPLPRRAFNPDAVTRKPAPAAALPAPPMVAAPPRPAPAGLPLPHMAPVPPPPPPGSPQGAVNAGAVTESIEVTSALPLLATQTAPGAPAPQRFTTDANAGARPGVPVVSIIVREAVVATSMARLDFTQTTAGAARPSGPSPAEPLPASGRATAGVVGGVVGSGKGGGVGSGVGGGVGGGVGPGVAGARGGFGTAAAPAQGRPFSAAPKSARELYDPSLAPVSLTSGTASAQAGGGRGGGGGGGSDRPGVQAKAAQAAPSAMGNVNINGGQTWQTTQQADAAPGSAATQANFARAEAAAQPAASLGVRYQVLRRIAGDEYQELAAGSDLAVGDAVSLRFIPNSSGYLCVFLTRPGATLLQRTVQPFEPVETDGIRVSNAPARLEFHVLFSLEEQPVVHDASPDSFIAKVRQGASGMISQAAGVEGVYVVNPAPGAQAGVPFIITLNFQ
jgi:hypothetical protein